MQQCLTLSSDRNSSLRRDTRGGLEHITRSNVTSRLLAPGHSALLPTVCVCVCECVCIYIYIYIYVVVVVVVFSLLPLLLLPMSAN